MCRLLWWPLTLVACSHPDGLIIWTVSFRNSGSTSLLTSTLRNLSPCPYRIVSTMQILQICRRIEIYEKTVGIYFSSDFITCSPMAVTTQFRDGLTDTPLLFPPVFLRCLSVSLALFTVGKMNRSNDVVQQNQTAKELMNVNEKVIFFYFWVGYGDLSVRKYNISASHFDLFYAVFLSCIILQKKNVFPKKMFVCTQFFWWMNSLAIHTMQCDTALWLGKATGIRQS